jgi:hypothetical protein
MTFREKGEDRYGQSLPFHSVDTKEQARHIQLTYCKKQYDGRYVVLDFGGEVDDIFALADKLGLD